MTRALCLSLLLACTGTIDDIDGAPEVVDLGPTEPPGTERRAELEDECADAPFALGSTPLRRLSNVEYRNTVRDLFASLPERQIPLLGDSMRDGFENDAVQLGADEARIEQYEATATELAAELSADIDALLSCEGGESEEACVGRLIEESGRDIFRRPVRDDESTRYMAYFNEARAQVSLAGAVELTLRAMLLSPQFLYRVEEGDPAVASPAGSIALDDYEIASRLSYLLWGSMPDQALFARAAAGELRDPAVRVAEARRMLGDARARSVVSDFHRQWFELDEVLHEERNAERFPHWSPELQEAIREETDRFVEHVTFDGEGDIGALFTSTTGFVNEDMAELYGVPFSGAAEWAEVALDPSERAGFLTRANFLANRSTIDNKSPVLRGAYIMERVICAEFGPPPNDADTSAVGDPGGGATNRELFEQRTSPGQCQGCHSYIDGFGFPLENYDATGAFVGSEQGRPVDASGWLRGTDVDGEVNGPIELSQTLAESRDVSDCVTLHWFRFATGRAEEDEDGCRLHALQGAVAEAGGNMLELMVALVEEEEFALLSERDLIDRDSADQGMTGEGR